MGKRDTFGGLIIGGAFFWGGGEEEGTHRHLKVLYH